MYMYCSGVYQAPRTGLLSCLDCNASQDRQRPRTESDTRKALPLSIRANSAQTSSLVFGCTLRCAWRLQSRLFGLSYYATCRDGPGATPTNYSRAGEVDDLPSLKSANLEDANVACWSKLISKHGQPLANGLWPRNWFFVPSTPPLSISAPSPRPPASLRCGISSLMVPLDAL